MEPQEQPESATYVKRPIKPEEQNLIDELARLTEQHADEFPNICQFMQKGRLIFILFSTVMTI